MTDPLRDPDRLLALRATELPDSAPEEAFDRLTRLVQRCLRVPVALVSLVDAERQYFKSAQGLAEPWCSARETPLSHSFCQHVVVRDAPLLVEDARQDPLVRDNLAVADLGVVAYLGVPLRTPAGHVLGSLCAIDGAPRAWTPADLDTLQALADEAMLELAHRDQRRAATAEGEAQGSALTQALLEALPHPAAVLRPDGTVQAASDGAVALADLPRPAVLGQRLWTVLPLDGDGEAALRAAVRDATREGAHVTAPVDGRAVALTVRAVPGGNGLLLVEARG